MPPRVYFHAFHTSLSRCDRIVPRATDAVGGRRLAAMAGAPPQRPQQRDGPAEVVARGRSDAALALPRLRCRIFGFFDRRWQALHDGRPRRKVPIDRARREHGPRTLGRRTSAPCSRTIGATGRGSTPHGRRRPRLCAGRPGRAGVCPGRQRRARLADRSAGRSRRRPSRNGAMPSRC